MCETIFPKIYVETPYPLTTSEDDRYLEGTLSLKVLS